MGAESNCLKNLNLREKWLYLMEKQSFSPDEWAICLKVLSILKEHPLQNPDNQTFKTLITAIHKNAKKEMRQSKSSAFQQNDFEKLKKTTIVANAQANTTLFAHQTVPQTDCNETPLNTPQNCYICHNHYTKLHFFYHRLCPDCAKTNYDFRQLEPDFTGFQVVLTGGRVKVGYATALKFLKSGANVLISSRFPALAWAQFSKEADFESWKDRLNIYGLDLRHLKSVYEFIEYCQQKLPYIDILINNAAQTIQYPLDYYQPLIQQEKIVLKQFKNPQLLGNPTPLTLQKATLLTAVNLPEIPLNRFGQPIDIRTKNSWNATLQDIGLEELLEVNLINHISPYILISELSNWMLQSVHPQRFIINVTSSEGQFSYAHKTIHHPHTNMTKAALNMLTRTAAADYVQKQIYMNSVDVGWISTGAAEEKRARLFEALKIPPLDSVDGAMRIIHPIWAILNGDTTLYGHLIKNYQVAEW
jgi:NAD(P)-dependent dehydrogenase (short-subunit alcohol dehydrogenase family)